MYSQIKRKSILKIWPHIDEIATLKSNPITLTLKKGNSFNSIKKIEINLKFPIIPYNFLILELLFKRIIPSKDEKSNQTFRKFTINRKNRTFSEKS